MVFFLFLLGKVEYNRDKAKAAPNTHTHRHPFLEQLNNRH